MGWCHEFGASIREGCDHPMLAGPESCECEQCGIVCGGRFQSCDAVWARGPRSVTLVRPVTPRLNGARPAVEKVPAVEQVPALEQVAALEHAEVDDVSERLAYLIDLIDALPGRIGAAVSSALRASARQAQSTGER